MRVMPQPLAQLGALVLLDLAYVLAHSARSKLKLDIKHFVSRRLAIGVLVAACMIIEPLLPGVPLTQVVIVYFCGVLVAHMINLATADGVPVPAALVTATRMLRDATEGTTTTKPADLESLK